MWPFVKKNDYGLTREEAKFVKNYSTSWKKRKYVGTVPKKDLLKIEQFAVALGLDQYARTKSIAPTIGGIVSRDDLAKALEAVVKAHQIYPLPIYLYERGVIMKKLGRKDDARNNFEEFLKQQGSLLPSHLDSLFDTIIGSHYVSMAVSLAKDSLLLESLP